MKTFTPSLAGQYSAPTTTLATLWRVERRDGVVLGYTDHDQDVVIDGVTYQAMGGLSATTVDSTTDFEGDTLDVTAFLDVAGEVALEAGDFDDAAILIAEYNWTSPPASLAPDQVNILRRGYLGQVQRTQGRFTAEILGLVQRLRTRLGAVVSPTCRYRFGDAFCTKPLGPLTHTGTLTAVSGSQPHVVAVDSASPVPAGLYNFGEIRFTSGDNAGRQMDIRTWSQQTLRLMRPLPFPMAVGDAYTAIEGCDKRFQSCVERFANGINFGGEPHVPGTDKLHALEIQAAPEPPRPAPPDGNPDTDSGGSSENGGGTGGGNGV